MHWSLNKVLVFAVYAAAHLVAFYIYSPHSVCEHTPTIEVYEFHASSVEFTEAESVTAEPGFPFLADQNVNRSTKNRNFKLLFFSYRLFSAV